MSGINKRVTFTGIFTALAVIFSYIESLTGIDALMPLYGLKIGLFNVAVISAMLLIGYSSAFLVMFIRCIIMSVFFGSVVSFLFSLSGGILSFFAMMFLLKTGLYGKKYTLIGISAAGAAVFNLGQIIMAAVLLRDPGVFYYLPVMLTGSIFTGTFIGVLSMIIINIMQKIPQVNPK